MAPTDESSSSYTVFIRVPFPRGEFVDPPIVKWDASKDEILWKVLSSTPKGGEIDWHGLAEKLDVALPFLLQQAAWLYARQLSQVREQLRRVKPIPNSSPIPTSVTGSAAIGGYSMKRGGSSGGSGSRGPSSLSVRPKASSELRNEGSVPGTPIQSKAPYSRTTSSNTVTQIPRASSGSYNTRGTSPRPRRSIDSEPTERTDSHIYTTEQTPKQPSNLDDPSDSSSSDDQSSVTQSRVFSRRHRFSSSKGKGKSKNQLQALSSADEDEEDDSPAFLPFSNTNQPPQASTGQREQAAPKGKAPVRSVVPPPKLPSASESSEAFSQSHHSSGAHSTASPARRPPNAVSSPTGAALAALSPRQRRIAQAGSESNGTPSMGSSFSDLDDASVTKSALEEALAREIKAGKGSLGVVSRMGGLWKQGMSGQSGGRGAEGSTR